MIRSMEMSGVCGWLFELIFMNVGKIARIQSKEAYEEHERRISTKKTKYINYLGHLTTQIEGDRERRLEKIEEEVGDVLLFFMM